MASIAIMYTYICTFIHMYAYVSRNIYLYVSRLTVVSYEDKKKPRACTSSGLYVCDHYIKLFVSTATLKVYTNAITEPPLQLSLT